MFNQKDENLEQLQEAVERSVISENKIQFKQSLSHRKTVIHFIVNMAVRADCDQMKLDGLLIKAKTEEGVTDLYNFIIHTAVEYSCHQT